VEEAYQAFSPVAGAIITEFFDKRWIDAELRPGKRGGAFSSSAVPGAHPYILMNFTDKLRDVMTLAHELGHGLHQYLARRQGYLQCDTPLTTAETASVFGEMLTFGRLREMFPEPRTQLALLCSKIEDGFATVFRQIVLTRFEQALHKARREQGELTTEQINELWLSANRPMHGDVVRLTDGYGWWWSYIGHFVHVPFYCYAYAFGELLVLALVQKYRQEGVGFVPKYLELLAAGGSESPPKLLAPFGRRSSCPRGYNKGVALPGPPPAVPPGQDKGYRPRRPRECREGDRPAVKGASVDHLPVIELLEKTHSFPGRYTFKAIGKVENGFAARVVAAVREELAFEIDPPHSLREAAGGRHVAVTLEPVVRSAQQVLAVYKRIRSVSGLVILW
jgi:putative lipoic acid-binding regulatory protein